MDKYDSEWYQRSQISMMRPIFPGERIGYGYANEATRMYLSSFVKQSSSNSNPPGLNLNFGDVLEVISAYNLVTENKIHFRCWIAKYELNKMVIFEWDAVNPGRGGNKLIWRSSLEYLIKHAPTMRQRLYASIVTKRVGAIDSVEKAQLLASYVQQFGYDYFELKWTDHALDQQRVVPEQVLVMLLCFNRWNSLENNPMIPNDLQWQIASYLLL